MLHFDIPADLVLFSALLTVVLLLTLLLTRHIVRAEERKGKCWPIDLRVVKGTDEGNP
jgi:hypothetical protein